MITTATRDIGFLSSTRRIIYLFFLEEYGGPLAVVLEASRQLYGKSSRSREAPLTRLVGASSPGRGSNRGARGLGNRVGSPGTL